MDILTLLCGHSYELNKVKRNDKKKNKQPYSSLFKLKDSVETLRHFLSNIHGVVNDGQKTLHYYKSASPRSEARPL